GKINGKTPKERSTLQHSLKFIAYPAGAEENIFIAFAVTLTDFIKIQGVATEKIAGVNRKFKVVVKLVFEVDVAFSTHLVSLAPYPTVIDIDYLFGRQHVHHGDAAG
ncbi:MAG: hypothetical protein JXR89_03025, partial [Deltaproteobacteria bacterium]|nr:hypothetical protein [Deltaproteobacteria bacterium]